ncbi:MAG: hypothetical protein LBU32_03975 [Clostridiales bacterium]|nr:hypothetical protein [Clostridiales bacterium]
MIAIAYLILMTFTGYIMISKFVPDALEPQRYMFSKDKLYSDFFPRIFFVFPASFTVGFIFCGWFAYIIAYQARSSGRAMFISAALSFIVLLALCLGRLILKRKDYNERGFGGYFKELADFAKNHAWTTAFLLIVFAYIYWLLTYTFFYEDGKLNMGYSIFSDFSVHTALIRSFSAGSNFPTQFPHFPDGTIRYHFMFQFVAGMLEYMGLRMDLAFNLISILALFGCSLLLYSLACLITGARGAGMLSVMFFFLRSSFSGVIYLFENAPYKSLSSFADATIKNRDFIGHTPNENWGLWNMNVYANQRHFALGISLLIFVMTLMLPHLQKMLGILLLKMEKPESTPENADEKPARPGLKGRALAAAKRLVSDDPRSLASKLREFAFTRDAWECEDFNRALFIAILVGATSFYHGSAVIALLSMLAAIGFFSKHRLEFLLIAAVAFFLSSYQAQFFAPGVEIASLRFQFGFIAQDKSLMGVFSYMLELTGLCLFVAAAAFLAGLRSRFAYFIAFSAPLILTFTISLTPDITVNHKYLMISLAFLNIFAAYGIHMLFTQSLKPAAVNVLCKAAACVLSLFLVLTGILDTFTIINQDGPGRSALVDADNDYQKWIRENTNPDDVFLCYWQSLGNVFFAGRPEFFGWPYYAWSGGYDTYTREAVFKEIVETADPDRFLQLVNDNKISYIEIDPEFLNNGNFQANPEIIESYCTLAYEDAEKQLKVYKTWYAPPIKS